MRIDRDHRRWAIASFSLLAAALVAYVPYAVTYPGGPRGNSFPGLVYGLLGYGMMLYAGLMGARKKVPIWRIGRAKTWMRGHLWMGALSVPMILFHSAFSARGPLTMVLMTLLFMVAISGLTGAVIQHVIPKKMASAVQLETIWEQIPHVREQLREEAGAIVARYSGGAVAVDDEERSVPLNERERSNLREVYVNKILPFLREPDLRGSPLGDMAKASVFFEALRRQSPPALHDALSDLETICEEERQLTRQRSLYYWLHGWLLVHVPLSITLLVLGAVHGLVSIRY